MSVAPPRPKGPPLNALRAFEAAARLGSFVAAAEELSVTPGAVSQHIRTLENWAGLDLFRRNARGVELTAVGKSLTAEFTAAFDALAHATHALRNRRADADIHIAALPAVAQLWLPKRLGSIRRQFPRMTFSVTAMEAPPRLGRELFDLAVFFLVPDGRPDQVIVETDRIFPVCAPSLAARMERPDALNAVPLIQDQVWRDDWQIWSAATGVSLTDPTDGPRYSLYSLAVEEAKAGAGVLMGHESLIGPALEDGSLVRCASGVAETGRALAISLPHPAIRRKEIDEVARLLGAWRLTTVTAPRRP